MESFGTYGREGDKGRSLSEAARTQQQLTSHNQWIVSGAEVEGVWESSILLGCEKVECVQLKGRVEENDTNGIRS